jgi:hypothetical protein
MVCIHIKKMPVTNSKIWGPSTWYFLHQIAYTFIRENRIISKKEQGYIKSFVIYLSKLLPCPSCRAHFSQTLRRYPITKENKTGQKFFNWTVRAHNLANKGLKKKVWNYAQAEVLHKKPVDLKKIFFFINVILGQSSNKSLDFRKYIAVCVSLLFPVQELRTRVVSYYKRNKPSSIVSHKKMNQWVQGLIAEIKKK